MRWKIVEAELLWLLQVTGFATSRNEDLKFGLLQLS